MYHYVQTAPASAAGVNLWIFLGPIRDAVPTIRGFVRAAVFLRALSVACFSFPIHLHIVRNHSSVLCGNEVSRFDTLGFLE